ncbi:hypothetical protein B0H14DRAFT_2567793 [Mycena olivaceomarginata]|nr:hypothetical protein B0H14DRAFT_2567793 [Mycena olivaceomarginata]
MPQAISIVHSQRPGTIYTTGTIHTRTGGVHSLPHSRSTSPCAPHVAALTSTGHPLRGCHRAVHRAPDVAARLDAAHDAQNLGNDSATTNNHDIPAAMVVQEGHAPEGSERVRLNPPAYSPYASSPGPADPMPQSPGRRELTPCHRTCREKASVDTQQSSDSGTTHGGGESVSATGIDECAPPSSTAGTVIYWIVLRPQMPSDRFDMRLARFERDQERRLQDVTREVELMKWKRELTDDKM